MKSSEFTGRSVEMKSADSPWLSSEHLMDAGDVEVEIEQVYKHVGAKFDDGREQTVHALKFRGKDLQLIVNNTNRKILVNKFKTVDVKQWIGKKITLYVAHGIKKVGGSKGETTTGIRIRP